MHGNTKARKNWASIATYKSTLEKLGVEYPHEHDEPANLTLATRDEVLDAAVEVVKAGKDPAASTKVRRLLTSWQLDSLGLSDQFELETSVEALERAQSHAQKIIPELAQRFDQQVSLMLELLERFGPVDLTDGVPKIAGHKTDDIVLLAELYQANEQATKTAGSWHVILQMGGISTSELMGRKFNLLWTKPTLQQWEEHSLDRHGLRPKTWHNRFGRPLNIWDALHDGIAVGLVVTQEDVHQRVDALHRAQEEAQREYEQLVQNKRKMFSTFR